MKTSVMSIESIKLCFRSHNSIYIDHAKDSQELLKYIYRLEKWEIIYPTCINKEFNMSIYSVNKDKINFCINYVTSN
jgi:hypothetical protein